MSDNPLTEEQIAKINEIAKMPPEQQQVELSEFLKTLSPEQIEFLKQQQKGSSGQQCPFCLIAEGKLDSKKVYEDQFFMAVLDINPASLGHVILFPKKHYQLLFQMSPEEISHMFNVAAELSKAVFEAVGAEGTNILISLGAVAGQRVPHVVVNIIPRKAGDGVDFDWQHVQVSEEEMNSVFAKISERASAIGKVSVNKVPEVKEEKTEEYYEEQRIPR